MPSPGGEGAPASPFTSLSRLRRPREGDRAAGEGVNFLGGPCSVLRAADSRPYGLPTHESAGDREGRPYGGTGRRGRRPLRSHDSRRAPGGVGPYGENRGRMISAPTRHCVVCASLTTGDSQRAAEASAPTGPAKMECCEFRPRVPRYPNPQPSEAGLDWKGRRKEGSPSAAPPLPIKAGALMGTLVLTIYVHYALRKAPCLKKILLGNLIALSIRE